MDYNYAPPFGSEDNLQSMHRGLRKKTTEAIATNQEFFDNLSDVENIYSYGFSFSDVDLEYIRKICSTAFTENIVWHLNEYECEDVRECYKKKILECGFKGKFSTFSINR